ncbi:MAG: aminoacyl-tRNA hydrolase [Acidobacteria bacterium]|jgi:PTH1 family peptidyl-tRNA hydrolase|nr:aminoacyl-tRNA hydrolase [Acidobacteriota bacterium]
MSSLDEKRWLVIGLGNPGKEYERTRHNLGFMLVERLAREFQTQIRREECRSLIGQAVFENQKIELVKPQTFMNLSGEAVNCLLKKDYRSQKKLIVAADDLALPFGRIRLRARGSAGGHNGLKTIIECLRGDEFIRLRIGIQPEHAISDTKRFVLDDFSKSDFETLEQVIDESAEAIRAVLIDGVEKAMAKHN